MEKKYATVAWPKSQKSIDFKDLPIEIQERILDEQVRQGNPRNAEVFENNIIANKRLGAFNWSESVEGYDFWEEIIQNGNPDIFYEKYPKESNRKLYSEEEVKNLFIKHCKDFYNIQGEFYKLLLEQYLKWFEENKK